MAVARESRRGCLGGARRLLGKMGSDRISGIDSAVAPVRGAGPAVAIGRTSPSTRRDTAGSILPLISLTAALAAALRLVNSLAAAALLDARAIGRADPASEVEKRTWIRIEVEEAGIWRAAER